MWCHGFTPDGDGYPRYVGTRGMNTIAKHMAGGLDVRLRRDGVRDPPRRSAFGTGGRSSSTTARSIRADAVVSTCPLPQTFSLLFEAGVDFPRELVADDYDRTIALLAVLDRPSAVPPPGGVQLAEGVFSFVADNAAKGISAVPAVTLHAAPGWSEEHWDDDRAAVHEALLEAARPWFGTARVVDSQVKRWRFATPRYAVARPVLDRARGLAGRRRRRVRRTEDRGCLQLGAGGGRRRSPPRDGPARRSPYARHPLSWTTMPWH